MPVEFVYSNTADYYNICKATAQRINEIDEQMVCLREETSADAAVLRGQLKDEREKCEAVVIVFAALCVESFINEYCAARISKHFLKRYGYNLGVVEKWVLIPWIVTGKDFRSSLGGLPDLIKARNRLVHSKPVVVSGEAELPTFILGSEHLSQVARRACGIIEELLPALGKLDKDIFHHFAIFDYLCD